MDVEADNEVETIPETSKKTSEYSQKIIKEVNICSAPSCLLQPSQKPWNNKLYYYSHFVNETAGNRSTLPTAVVSGRSGTGYKSILESGLLLSPTDNSLFSLPTFF